VRALGGAKTPDDTHSVIAVLLAVLSTEQQHKYYAACIARSLIVLNKDSDTDCTNSRLFDAHQLRSLLRCRVIQSAFKVEYNSRLS
jgi:hypothetical protein